MQEEYSYRPDDIWNMDESDFGIGEEQAFKVLVYLEGGNGYKEGRDHVKRARS
jgi:hypothetical protein